MPWIGLKQTKFPVDPYLDKYFHNRDTAMRAITRDPHRVIIFSTTHCQRRPLSVVAARDRCSGKRAPSLAVSSILDMHCPFRLRRPPRDADISHLAVEEPEMLKPPTRCPPNLATCARCAWGMREVSKVWSVRSKPCASVMGL